MSSETIRVASLGLGWWSDVLADGVVKANGIEGATMDHIAQESGFGKATLYYYFKSKEDVADTNVEDINTQEVYESDKYLNTIANYIIENHNRKTHHRTFTAIFCVSSVLNKASLTWVTSPTKPKSMGSGARFCALILFPSVPLSPRALQPNACNWATMVLFNLPA